MPTNTRFPSPVKVQVRGGWHLRGAIALHTPASSGQHRFPVCGPMAGLRPYAYKQVHEESQGTDHAVWYDPFLTQSPAAQREEKRFFSWRAPRNNHTPDPKVFSSSVQPNTFRITLPGPGDTGELSGHEGRATATAHPGMISTSWENFRPCFCKKPAHVSSCIFKGVCYV